MASGRRQKPGDKPQREAQRSIPNRSGLYVKFSGEIDEKGTLKQDLKELQIFTPKSKSATGIFTAGSNDSAKPLNRYPAGKYDFRGRVLSYKEGELVVLAGKKITAKVVSGADIKVNVQDFSVARIDDELKIKGWYLDRNIPQKGRPGQAIAKTIEVTLAKPLRAPLPTITSKVTKLAGVKQAAEPASQPAAGNKADPKVEVKDNEKEAEAKDSGQDAEKEEQEKDNASKPAVEPKARKKLNPLSSD